MKKILVVLIILFTVGQYSQAQQVYEKKEIALFSLGYYDTGIPSNVIGSLDTGIGELFLDMKRFKVLGIGRRIKAGNVNEFVSLIRSQKEKNIEVEEKFTSGEETFTQKDLNELLGSFVLVIPNITFYEESKTLIGTNKIEVHVSFSFIDVNSLNIEDILTLKITQDDYSKTTALKKIITGLRNKLSFELKKIAMFTLITGITHIDGSTLEIEFGKNMGIKKGYEFAVINDVETESGRKNKKETALIIVDRVFADYSRARLIYATSDPVIGDAIKEIPRVGFDMSIFFQPILLPNRDPSTEKEKSYNTTMAGLKFTTTKDSFDWRLLAEVTIPLSDDTRNNRYIPANVYLGLEYNFIWGRFRMTPMAAIGTGALITLADGPDNNADGLLDTVYEKNFYFSHLGGKAFVSFNYLFLRDWRVYLEGGLYAMGSLHENLFLPITGASWGLGVTLKL